LLKKRDADNKRKERLAFVSLSLSNIIPKTGVRSGKSEENGDDEKPEKKPKKKRAPVSGSSTGGSSDSSDGSSSGIIPPPTPTSIMNDMQPHNYGVCEKIIF